MEEAIVESTIEEADLNDDSINTESRDLDDAIQSMPNFDVDFDFNDATHYQADEDSDYVTDDSESRQSGSIDVEIEAAAVSGSIGKYRAWYSSFQFNFFYCIRYR